MFNKPHDLFVRDPLPGSAMAVYDIRDFAILADGSEIVFVTRTGSGADARVKRGLPLIHDFGIKAIHKYKKDLCANKSLS